MKQRKNWIKIVSIVLTVVLFTETAGVNIVSYCCGDSIVSLFPVQESESCEFHSDHSVLQLGHSCACCKGDMYQEHQKADCTDLKWVHQSFENTISRTLCLLPLFFLDQVCNSLFSFVPRTTTLQVFIAPDLPVKSSRHYLSVIQVFLI